ncbi:class D sortase [Sutcliffiella rhizosphaerae]|uniref:Sortase D n=1 Tax=Sutcliffiella rhizosphaerae TaxID=2880967 RepID=A0ABN8A8H3_9BACI|nr:class D sortase [Sutcliffiella rhizosphaerae]CAG9621389.1 Sortase D [Sutcliffiella rhizosphaerae]
MKKGMVFAIVFMVAGLSFIGYGLFEKIKIERKTEAALRDAVTITAKVNPEEKERPVKPDDFQPETGEVVGLLKIPRLEAELPIVEGTDPAELEKGVGHYKGSSFPGELGQIVFSGHRDTVFLRLGELEIGDKFYVFMPYGEYMYEIYDSKIVDEDDRTVITLQKEQEDLILTTCYPFTLTGAAPERYILYAKPVNSR